MADDVLAKGVTRSTGLYALAAKSKAAGLNVQLLIFDGTRPDSPTAEIAWACMRVDQFSHMLDKALTDPARHISAKYRALDFLDPYPWIPQHDAERIVHRVAARERQEPADLLLTGTAMHIVALRDIAEGNSTAVIAKSPAVEFSNLLANDPAPIETNQTPKDLLKDKAIAAIVRLVEKASEKASLEALAAPDEVSSLITFLASTEVAGLFANESRDPLASATARGTAQRKALLEAEGGSASAQEIADLLGISRQAVDKRRKKGTLLAVPSGSNDWRYPRWQILEGRVIPGFEQVMSAFEATGPWTRLQFFLSANERLEDRRPLDALRHAEIEPVIEAAAAHGEHGAR